MKQYVLFSETYPNGIVVDDTELSQYENEDGNLYEIGKRLGPIQTVLESQEEELK